MKKYIPIYFILISNLLFPQIYTLQNNETLKNAHILNDTNYAIIIEKNNANNKTYDILYKNSRLEGYRDSGIIKVLPNGTLVATMLKPSIGKDMWVVIYGNKEQEFDSIEASAFAEDNSIIFARLMDYGIAVITTMDFDEIEKDIDSYIKTELENQLKYMKLQNKNIVSEDEYNEALKQIEELKKQLNHTVIDK